MSISKEAEALNMELELLVHVKAAHLHYEQRLAGKTTSFEACVLEERERLADAMDDMIKRHDND